MTSDTPIECTIHWLADGREGQRNSILRDRSIGQLIPGLVERLGLREHTDSPTQSVATLHSGREAPPFPSDSTLAEAGVRDGDRLWLILTPTFLPMTVHWSAGERQGEHAARLPADQTIGAQIAALVDQLGLRELVDGPLKAIAILRPAADAPAWDEAQALLDLDVRIGAHVWLDLTPRFMPITLHWTEDGQELQKRRYLSVGKSIGEHIDDLVGLLGVERAINGPSRSVPSLHTDPRGPALPPDRTLLQAGVRADDALWFALTPTFVTVTLYYPAGETTGTRQLTVPRTRPLQEVGTELAKQIGLGPLGASKITLHPAADARPWPAATTLADHHVHDGSDIWLKIAPATSAARFPRWATIAGGAAIGLILIVLLGLAWRLWQGTSQGATLGTPVPPRPTAVRVPPTPTATPVPPSPTPDIHQDRDYILGQQALAGKDWLVAIAAFERVRARYPNNAEMREILAMVYYQYAESTLTTPDAAGSARVILRQTFVYSPTHQLGRNLDQRLGLYLAGRASSDKQDWPAAIAAFERLRALQPDFLDVTRRLYGAYMAYGAQLEPQITQQKNIDLIPTAYAMYQKAAKLPGVDASKPLERIAALELEPRLRADRISETGTPTCFEVRVDGTNISGWELFVKDGRSERSMSLPANGVAKMCQFREKQGLEAWIRNQQHQAVLGGYLDHRRAGDIVVAPWR